MAASQLGTPQQPVWNGPGSWLPRQVAAYLNAGASPRAMRRVITWWPHPGDYEDAWRNNEARLRERQLPPPPPPGYTPPPGTWLALAGTPEYPVQLEQAPAAPLLLFGRGRREALRPGVAVVGSRRLSAYGRAVATIAVSAAARSGVPVVSGAALGADTAAAEAALEVEVPTVAVLATGVDVPYPAGNAPLLERIIAAGGAVVSEQPFGTGPDHPGRAPLAARLQARNRIIAGLSMLTVPVEAAPGSGTLGCIWATLAMGRPVIVGLPKPSAGPLPGAVVPLALAAPVARSLEQLRGMGAPHAVAEAWAGRFPLAAGAHDRDELHAVIQFAVAASPHHAQASMPEPESSGTTGAGAPSPGATHNPTRPVTAPRHRPAAAAHCRTPSRV